MWTTDLHSRFKAAVKALGLETAKPKTILKLMNVEGLTKANIKSHLQKYRCSMQKKAVQAAGKEGGGDGPTAKLQPNGELAWRHGYGSRIRKAEPTASGAPHSSRAPARPSTVRSRCTRPRFMAAGRTRPSFRDWKGLLGWCAFVSCSGR